MSGTTRTYSESPGRFRGAHSGTLVAALLLLAILPSAAAITCPNSAAIIEGSLTEARIVHVQRERPDLPRSRAVKADQRALAQLPGASNAGTPNFANSAARTATPSVAGSLVSITPIETGLAPAQRIGSRAGLLGLPPPRA